MVIHALPFAQLALLCGNTSLTLSTRPLTVREPRRAAGGLRGG